MLTPDQQTEILNDFFAWSGGDLPADEQHVNEYMAVSYCLNYPEEAARAYLISEIFVG